jgi:hypothetical protein
MGPRLASLTARARAGVDVLRAGLRDLRATLGPAHLVLVGAVGLFAASAALPGASAAIALVRFVLVLAGGALGAWVWPQLPRSWRRGLDLLGRIAAPLVVARVGFELYELPLLVDKRGALLDDWAPHHVQVSVVAEAMREGRTTRWTHLLFAGEPLGDLYPAFGTYVAAWVTNHQQLTEDVPRALALVGAGGLIAIAVAVTTLSLRIVRWPFALAAGLLSLFDGGNSVSSGSGAVFVLALYQHALGQAFSLFAVAAALWSVQRPAAWRSLLVWVLAALAMVAHPLSLISLLPFVCGFAVAPIVATDARLPRIWRGARDLLIGMFLAAPVWMPLLENVLRYGLHYGSPPAAPSDLAAALVSARFGISTFAAFVAAGFFGIVAGLWSRSAAAVVVAVGGLVAMLLGSDFPFLLAGLGPSPSFARFAGERTQGVMRLALLVLSVYLVDHVVLRGARTRRVRPAGEARARIALGAVAAGIGLLILQLGFPYAQDRTRLQRDETELDVPDPQDFRELVDWFGTQRDPSRGVQRVYFEDTHAYPFHISARVRLPVIRTGYAAGTMLRERIDAKTLPMLRRYNVAWAVRRDGASPLGDSASERRFGAYRVRTVPDHDGRVARIARGRGRVRVTRFEDDRVELELGETREPALVELGISYYPRWRARQNGRDVPVYAALAHAGHAPRILALWLRPGRTTLTPDGPLPTDHRGDAAMVCAALAALLVLGLGVWRTGARRLRRVVARTSRALRPHRFPLAVGVAVIAALVAALTTLRGRDAEALALVPTRVLAADARVRFLPDGESPRRCPFRWQMGYFDCGIEYGRIGAGHIPSLNDLLASWPYVVPAIRIFPGSKLGVVEIAMRRRVSGTWLAASWGFASDTRLSVDEEPAHTLETEPRVIDFGERVAMRSLWITTRIVDARRASGVAAVARRALDLDRERDVPWVPDTPPRL